MPTPHFKLLLHALRLGQPQDPQAAIRAMAEAIAVDHAALEDLKARLGVMQARAQNLDAKVSLIEADVVESRLGVSAHYEPPGSGRPPAPTQVAPSQHPPPLRQQPPQQPQAPQAHPQQPYPQQSQFSPELQDARGPTMQADDSDDYHDETAVITRGEVAAALKAAGAPFQIAPAGGPPPRKQLPSIPGAPWAHTSGAVPPIPTDDFTMDVEDQRAAVADEEDGETFADSGVKPPRPPRR